MKFVLVSSLVLIVVASLFCGCYLSQWCYYPDRSTESFRSWSIYVLFNRAECTGPPETSKGDTAFVLLVDYHCTESPCSTNLEIANAMIVHGDSKDAQLMGMHYDYRSERDSISSIVRLGPWPRGKVPDTVTIEFDLVAMDKNTGEAIETKRVRVVGSPVHEKTGLIRAMVRGV